MQVKFTRIVGIILLIIVGGLLITYVLKKSNKTRTKCHKSSGYKAEDLNNKNIITHNYDLHNNKSTNGLSNQHKSLFNFGVDEDSTNLELNKEGVWNSMRNKAGQKENLNSIYDTESTLLEKDYDDDMIRKTIKSFLQLFTEIEESRYTYIDKALIDSRLKNEFTLYLHYFTVFFETEKNNFSESLNNVIRRIDLDYNDLDEIDFNVLYEHLQSNPVLVIDLQQSNSNNTVNLRKILIDLYKLISLHVLPKVVELYYGSPFERNHDEIYNIFYTLTSSYELLINMHILIGNININTDDLIEQYASLRRRIKPYVKLNCLRRNYFTEEYIDIYEKVKLFIQRFDVKSLSEKYDMIIESLNGIGRSQDEEEKLTVRRDNVLEDSLFKILNLPPGKFKKNKLKIEFIGESGLDHGGLTREWLHLVVKEIFDLNYGLFTYNDETRGFVLPSKESDIHHNHLDYFKFFGRLLAKIIIDRCPLNLNLTRSVYKYILDKKLVLDDLKQIDEALYNSLIWMKNNSVEDVLSYTFAVDENKFGRIQTVELKPNGTDIDVTDENKFDYIELFLEYKLVNSIKPQLDAIKEGLFDILDKESVSLLIVNELELLLCGNTEIDIDDWENNTVYHGYEVDDDNIKWFWRAVKSFTSEQQTKLLHFSTGLQRVPFGGFSKLQDINGDKKFSITKINYTSSRWPRSHTCFNILDLPEYSSYEELKENLIYAITEGSEGFGLA